MGFTKIEAMTGWVSASAWRATCFIHSIVRMVSKRDAWRRLRPRGGGLLAIVADQIRGDRLGAELPHHRHDLPAVIAGVVCELVQALPERVREFLARECLVDDHAIQILLRHF